jgi:hypothetical protein
VKCRSHVGPRSCGSVKLEIVFVVLLPAVVVLFLVQHGITHDQQIDFGSHEATEGVFGRTHDGLAAHIETRIY